MSDRDERGRLLPGHSLGPSFPRGRRQGSRSRFTRLFFQALYDDFEAHGAQAIDDVRRLKPADYLRVCASLLPKDLEIKEDVFEPYADEELVAVLEYLTAMKAAGMDSQALVAALQATQ